MSVCRLATAGVAASLFAAVAGAQTPGTLEVGGYGQYTIFDERTQAENKIGVGGRVGVFFTPRWSFEGEASYTKLEGEDGASIGRNDDTDHYSPLALRLNYNLPFATNSALIVGGGVTRSDYGTVYNYGPSALLGARIGFGRAIALRVDGVYNYLPDEAAKIDEFYLRAGLSAFIPGSSPMTAEQQAQMGGAPQPGTVEIGGFGQYSFFDDDLNLDNAFGYGGRLGVFVTPIIQPEVDFSYTEADQETGNRSNLRVVPIAARLNFNFPFGARNAFILGAGASRTSYPVVGSPVYGDEDGVGGAYNWGASGLAGVRVGLGQRVALRLDAVGDYLPEPKFFNAGLRAGLSLLLGGARPAEPVVVAPPVDTTTPPPVDTTPVAPPAPDTAGQGLRQAQEAARAALTAVIYFDFDRSNIRQDAASILDAKIPYLQANPEMRIRIIGNTDTRGSDEYNLALGQRRAAAARRYLTQRGIDASRIEVASRGEENPVTPTRPARRAPAEPSRRVRDHRRRREHRGPRHDRRGDGPPPTTPTTPTDSPRCRWTAPRARPTSRPRADDHDAEHHDHPGRQHDDAGGAGGQHHRPADRPTSTADDRQHHDPVDPTDSTTTPSTPPDDDAAHAVVGGNGS
jgi:peptidoglycan-associated lipoprotein